MSQYTYDTIVLPASGAKPLTPAYANKGFLYNELADDRRFEELIYNIYATAPLLSNRYDTISLMSGVRDKGRDCALFLGGRSVGIIQCKKYASNLTKQLFGEEITKYILHSILEPQLLPDPTAFIYYIAVSKAFNRDCSDFIDNFNNLAPDETDLPKWIDKNLKQPTLQSLKLEDTLSRVKEVFQKIKVLKILPQDLDAQLQKDSCRHLIPLFFQAYSVTDNTLIQELIEKLDAQDTTSLSVEKLQEQLKRCSSSLKIEKNEFDEIPNSHIPRQETQELLGWIQSKALRDKQDRDLNVCILAGNAGMGKTVILKDLYDALVVKGIPVLGLKTDKIHAANLQDLKDKIGLGLPITDFIEQCKEKYNQTVIIIDQIDALSQSMSSDRNYLEVFKSLIDQFTHDAGVRIIISVRIFDLNYDPSLRIYKELKKIEVQPLEQALVLDQLKKLDIEPGQVSAKLLSLLQTPNHLNIFARIATRKKAAYRITSFHGLYSELWKQKVVALPHELPVSTKEVKKLLYKMAQKMFKNQEITLDESHFEEDARELNYLESERIIKREGRQVQFFHQSFYDFVFARRFVEKSEDLIGYIHDNEQSLLIRSAVRMILNYLREYSKKSYYSTLENLFGDTSLFFHVRYMAFSVILVQDEPTEKEIEIVAAIAGSSLEFNLLFLENVHTGEWLRVALDHRLMDRNFITDTDSAANEQTARYRATKIAQYLVSQIAKHKDIAWEYVLQSGDVSLKENILYDIEDWSIPQAYTLLEQCPDYREHNSFGFYWIMTKIAKANPLYCFEQVKGFIFNKTDQYNANGTNYQQQEVLKSIAKRIPGSLIPVLLNEIIKELKQVEATYKAINDDHIYTSTTLDTKKDEYGTDFNYWLLAQCLRSAAVSGLPEFEHFVTEHTHSRSEALLRLIIFSVHKLEEKYSTLVYDLFIHLHKNEHLKTASDLGVEFRDVFQNAFLHFSLLQQAEVVRCITSLKLKQEACIWPWGEKPAPHLNWGECQFSYLKRLPQNYIAADPDLKKRYQELQRKFPELKDRHNSKRRMAGIVTRPLSETAYEKMTEAQWIKSFHKYNGERDSFGDDWLKGDLSEHSWAFRDYCKKQPGDDKVRIIEHCISNTAIHSNYASLGLMGLAESHYEPAEVLRLFKAFQPLATDTLDSDNCIRIAQYLIRDEVNDPVVIQYLAAQALDWKSRPPRIKTEKKETSIQDMISRGINTSHGAAIEALLRITDKEYEGLVFTILEKVLADGPQESRALIFHHFAYLNKLNRHRSYNTFIQWLAKEQDTHVRAAAIWSLQYMGAHDFKRLIPIFEGLIATPELGEKESHWLFSILYFSCLYERADAQRLVLKMMELNTYCRPWALREIFKHFYFNESATAISQTLLAHLAAVVNDGKAVKPELKHLKMDYIKLPDIYAFLKAYIIQGDFFLSEGFIKYLTGQCKGSVFDAILIFNLALEKNKAMEDFQQAFHTNDQMTRFVVGAFSAITGHDAHSKAQRKVLLESFDTILMDYRYRNFSDRILDELI